MLATQMPQPSHLALSSSSHAEPSASLPIMSSAPSQTTAASHSTMSYGLTSNATTQPPLSRPKLTLQTSSLPMTFGSSSTGLSLSLAAGSTASPTVRNTFKNAYDVTYPSSATASPSRSTGNRFSKPGSPYTSSNPYQLSLGVKSILRNSLLESNKRRPNSVAQTGPTGASTSRRVYFPTKKQVSYRYPLEEEIKTVKFTTRHSDIASDTETVSCETSSDEDDSDYSTSSLVSSDTTPSDDDAENRNTSDQTSDKKKKKRKYRSAERQIRAVAIMEGLEDPYAATPQTPRQGRLKRRREWKWTLGPLEDTGNTTDSTHPTSASHPTPTPTLPEATQRLESTTANTNTNTNSPPKPVSTSTFTSKLPKLSLSITTTSISDSPSHSDNDTSQPNTALSPLPTSIHTGSASTSDPPQ
ncbi:hypothetical protein BJX70DRAFT_306029 [Aspergillus crustosus]